MPTLRPSAFSRWLTQPTELLLRTTRASPVQSQPLSLTLRPRFSASAPQTRSFNALAHRTRTCTRPTHLQPRQRTTLTNRNTRRTNSSSSTSNSNTSAKEDNSLSQRLRTLSREYGWAALGVYLGLSALDFPVCFVAVRLLGVERIGYWEHVVVSSVKDVVKSVWPQAGSGSGESEAVREEGEGARVSAEEEGNLEEASMFLSPPLFWLYSVVFWTGYWARLIVSFLQVYGLNWHSRTPCTRVLSSSGCR